jgi:hypothetical protein
MTLCNLIHIRNYSKNAQLKTIDCARLAALNNWITENTAWRRGCRLGQLSRRWLEWLKKADRRQPRRAECFSRDSQPLLIAYRRVGSRCYGVFCHFLQLVCFSRIQKRDSLFLFSHCVCRNNRPMPISGYFYQRWQPSDATRMALQTAFQIFEISPPACYSFLIL